MQAKPFYKSKTIWFNILTIIPAILSVLGLLEQILAAINLDQLPEGTAGTVAALLALVGAINVVLRMVTKQPVKLSKS